MAEIVKHATTSIFVITQGPGSEVEWNRGLITKISYECRWGLTGFYPKALVYHVFIKTMC